MTNSRNDNRRHRTRRIRAKIAGTATRPRVSIFRSLKNFSAQVIDDDTETTICAGSLREAKAENTIDGAAKLGAFIAQQCKEKKIDDVIFDRAGYAYHGKVKSFAQGLRDGGISV